MKTKMIFTALMCISSMCISAQHLSKKEHNFKSLIKSDIFKNKISNNVSCQLRSGILDDEFGFFIEPDSVIGFWEDGSKSDKEICFYDANNNITQEEIHDWNEDTNSWEFESKEIYSYDSQNNPVLFESFDWDNGWQNSSKTELHYSTGGNLELTENYNWDKGNEKWIIDSKYVWTNDSKGNVILGESYTWDKTTEDWIKDGKETYNYNSENKLISEEDMKWDEDLQAWINESKYVYSYNNLGLVVSVETYSWDELSNDWNLDCKDVFTYDSNKRAICWESFSWNNDDNNWWIEKHNITYDSEGHYLSERAFDWDQDGEMFIIAYSWIGYPHNLTSNLLLDEIKPINEDNTGILTLGAIISTNATITGSFVIQFPEKITLNENLTELMDELSAGVGLNITKQANNTWLIQINSNSIQAKTTYLCNNPVLNISYNISSDLPKGQYKIVLKDINLKIGNVDIPDKTLEFEINTNNQTSVKTTKTSNELVYVQDGKLYVNSQRSEKINIYSIDGLLVYSGKKAVGNLCVNILNVHKSILIIKGSSGWVQKIKCR